jgi:excisionase family DNA binding protein
VHTLAHCWACKETKMETVTTSIAEAGKALSLGRTTINQLIKSQQLDTIKIGRRRLIKTESIRRLIDKGFDTSLAG